MSKNTPTTIAQVRRSDAHLRVAVRAPWTARGWSTVSIQEEPLARMVRLAIGCTDGSPLKFVTALMREVSAEVRAIGKPARPLSALVRARTFDRLRGLHVPARAAAFEAAQLPDGVLSVEDEEAVLLALDAQS